MIRTDMSKLTDALKKIKIEGNFFTDTTMRTLYATDASAYREMPLAVAIPKTIADIKTLIAFANDNKTSIIPRTAGTSLAGQVVGNGIVVDVSKHFNKILEINEKERWVRVQPGVIRDELNMALKPYNLYFGPETSTANRAMIGGMVGNNSCGSNSVVYGSTREHLLEVKVILSDGSEATFGGMNNKELEIKNDSENKIYESMRKMLSDPKNIEEIHKNFPKKSIERRNTGYALDLLVPSPSLTPIPESLSPVHSGEGKGDFDLTKLIAGSEGTLCFLTEIKLNLVPPPPKEQALLCGHFRSIDEALRANILTLKYKPQAVELIDNYVLECADANVEQRANSFFVQKTEDDKFPIILVVDVSCDTRIEVAMKASEVEAELRVAELGYHFPLLLGDDTKKIWALRKAGLGLLGNLPGDEKAVAVIEDTAVDIHDQPAYIRDFNEILTKNNMSAVHYAHAGSGELHLRPIINLKTKEGHKQFRMIAEEIATLVKKYDGSLSGEHGDGRLRGEFIPLMVGQHNYELFKEVKRIWDPNNIFNPGKIVDTPPMDTFLRYEADHVAPDFKTYFRFENQTMLQHTEQCNGSGDCRKTELSGGTMCPSFMATRNEKDTTRARANILREMLTSAPTDGGTFSSPALSGKESGVGAVLDLCLACKGCKGECPSNVDVAKLKMEFLQHQHDAHGVPFRSWLIGNFALMSKIASFVPWAYNFIYSNNSMRRFANKMVGFHPDRTIPLLNVKSSMFGGRKNITRLKPVEHRASNIKHQIYLFIDEFTQYNDGAIGTKAIELLQKLGYEVIIPKHTTSGRPQLSKGLLKDAKKIAEKNVRLLKDIVSEQTPLVGIEPSAILTFRDEYPDLVSDELVEDAKKLAKNVLQFDEFIAREIDKKNISRESFTQQTQLIKLHGHCQQKAIASMTPTKKMLSLPQNYNVQLIPSGCCGMAGSFGYEAEHYDLSIKIGELVLFPTVRKQPDEVIIAAPGTSCRHQIHDGTGRKALHPIEILWEALLN
jgi:FAD/FMN-containing dehydrogenase/Fe-S oxidoreductase